MYREERADEVRNFVWAWGTEQQWLSCWPEASHEVDLISPNGIGHHVLAHRGSCRPGHGLAVCSHFNGDLLRTSEPLQEQTPVPHPDHAALHRAADAAGLWLLSHCPPLPLQNWSITLPPHMTLSQGQSVWGRCWMSPWALAFLWPSWCTVVTSKPIPAFCWQ